LQLTRLFHSQLLCAVSLSCRFDDVVGDNICPIDVELKWMTEVSSSVYATPLITDLYADGRKDIIVPGFVHYTEVLEGPDGAKALGWPAFHKSTVHASPLLYDIDSDGIRDILVATYDGEIVFFKDNVSAVAVQLHTRLVWSEVTTSSVVQWLEQCASFLQAKLVVWIWAQH
jgi:hypothetical protein